MIMESAMDIHFHFGFLEISVAALKSMSRNGSFMAFASVLNLLLYFTSYQLNRSSIKPWIYDLIMEMKFDLSSLNPRLKFFFLLYFTQAMTVVVSATSYSGKDLGFKDLLLKIQRSWTKPFVTSYDATLFGLLIRGFGHVLLMIASTENASKGTVNILAVLFLVFHLYIAIVHVLGMVVSVLEESCGIKAMEKAVELAKGFLFHGFMASFLSTMISLALFHGLNAIVVDQSSLKQRIYSGLFICAMSVVSTIQFLVFTLLYFKSKKTLGQEIELQGSTECGEKPENDWVRTLVVVYFFIVLQF